MKAGATLTVRDVVTARIAQQAKRWPELALTELDTSSLDERDARLAHAIDQAVARRWLTLKAVIDRCLSRNWETLQPQVQASLLVGAAQMLLMERVPDHAAIDEAVEWTKRRAGGGAGGLVNAVLRKVAGLRGPANAVPQQWHGFGALPREAIVLGDGRVRPLKEPVFAEGAVERTAQQCSLPRELMDRWIGAFGAAEALKIALHGLVAAPVIVTGMGEGESAKPQAGLTPHREPGFFVFEGDRAALVEFLGAHPRARVQDPGSAAPIAATAALKPRLIIDYCAGRGTKTRQLAQLHPLAKIIATDVDDARRAILREALVNQPQVEVVEPRDLARFAGKADLLMLDVPCSNTGVLARRVEAKYRFSRQTIADLVDVQRQIVADSLALLAGDGRLLYCTCSLEAAENGEQAAWIGRWHRMKVAASELRKPRGLPGEPPAGYSDDSFFALMRR